MRNFYLLLLVIPGLILGYLIEDQILKSKLASFVFDDLPVILYNPQLHSSSLLSALSFNPFRSVVYFSYWLQIRFLYGGALTEFDVGMFRTINVFLHLGTGLILIRLFQLLFPTQKYLALAPAYLFWLHPVSLEAENLVLGRTEIMLALFFLLSLCFYLSPKQSRKTRVGFFLCFLLALFSKEMAVLLPGVMILLSWFKGERVKRVEFIGSLILVLIYLVLRGNWKIELAKTPEQIPSWHLYFLNQNWIFWFSTFKILFPIHLNFDYALGNYPGLGLCFLIFNLLLFSGLFWISQNRWRPGFLFLIYPLLYLPFALIPFADSFRETRIYLSSAWLFLLISLGWKYLLEKRKNLGLSICLMIILVCFSLLSHQRAQVWKQGKTLWRDAVQKSPKKFRPVFNYANALRRTLELDRAKKVYLWAKSLDPENLKVEQNLLLIEQVQKNPALIDQLKKSLPENQR